MHLGMSGSLAFGGAPEPGSHDHFDLVTDRGTLRLTDPRRFGAVVWSPSLDSGAAGKLLARLGIEPFDPAFDGAHLYAALHRRKVAVKQALLGGEIVVGAGNIYACEALFEARIDPRTRCDRLSRPRAARLAAAVRARSPAPSTSAARRCAISRRPRRRRRVPAAGPRLRPRRVAVRALRRHRATDRPGRARDLFLPRLPTPLTRRRRSCETPALAV